MTAELSAGIIEVSEKVDGAHPENVCIFFMKVSVNLSFHPITGPSAGPLEEVHNLAISHGLCTRIVAKATILSSLVMTSRVSQLSPCPLCSLFSAQ